MWTAWSETRQDRFHFHRCVELSISWDSIVLAVVNFEKYVLAVAKISETDEKSNELAVVTLNIFGI